MDTDLLHFICKKMWKNALNFLPLVVPSVEFEIPLESSISSVELTSSEDAVEMTSLRFLFHIVSLNYLTLILFLDYGRKLNPRLLVFVSLKLHLMWVYVHVDRVLVRPQVLVQNDQLRWKIKTWKSFLYDVLCLFVKSLGFSFQIWLSTNND